MKQISVIIIQSLDRRGNVVSYFAILYLMLFNMIQSIVEPGPASCHLKDYSIFSMSSGTEYLSRLVNSVQQ